MGDFQLNYESGPKRDTDHLFPHAASARLAPATPAREPAFRPGFRRRPNMPPGEFTIDPSPGPVRSRYALNWPAVRRAG